MTTPELPPYSGEDVQCPKCGHVEATTRHREAGEPRAGEIVFLARAALYPERLERECWSCNFTWDEATVQQKPASPA